MALTNRAVAGIVLVLSVTLLVVPGRGAQLQSSGQNIQPVFEGWERNEDGSFNLVFGYFNRNSDEEVYVPIGPNNNVTPTGPDAGQPEYFYPIRNMFVFRIRVPKDFGTKDIVWTVTHRGRTDTAVGSLLPTYIIDDDVIGMNFGGGHPAEGNKAPAMTLEGAAERRVKVGEPLTLAVRVRDDGFPAKVRPAPQPHVGAGPPGRLSSVGVRVSWIQYRGGPATAKFSPAQPLIYSDPRSPLSPWAPGWTPQALPPSGEVVTKATLSQPGAYVLRAIAHDGYSYSTQDVRVTVTE
jgi:hypothetical protein